MSKHDPKKKQSCSDFDRCADEQMAMAEAENARLELEIARLRAEVAGLRSALAAPRYPNVTPAPYNPGGIVTYSANGNTDFTGLRSRLRSVS